MGTSAGRSVWLVFGPLAGAYGGQVALLAVWASETHAEAYAARERERDPTTAHLVTVSEWWINGQGAS